MSWINYRKAYEMVPHSWILECARMVGVAQNIITLIENCMANWKTVLISNQEVLGSYQLKKERCKINNLLFMDNLKLYGKNSSLIDSLVVQTVWSYSEDIGIKFGIDKCAVLELERGRLVSSDGIELLGGERMKEVDQEG